MVKMFDLQFIETSYGNLLINPIGDNLFIFNKKTEMEFVRLSAIRMLYGEGHLEI